MASYSNEFATFPWHVLRNRLVLFHDRSLAVAMAAKTRTVPCGGEIRVVHTPTGEVIFRKHNDCGHG
jgi:hypothetical protein